MEQQHDDDDGLFVYDDEDDNAQADKYLLFNLKDEVYGVSIVHVTEIVEMQRITDVPDLPDFVKGVINLRGKVIPVIDLRLRFGMEARPYDDRTCIIIVDIDDTALGFIVDTVAEVHDIREQDIDPPPNFKTDSGRNRFIGGLGKVGDRITVLVEAERILREKDLRAIQVAT